MDRSTATILTALAVILLIVQYLPMLLLIAAIGIVVGVVRRHNGVS